MNNFLHDAMVNSSHANRLTLWCAKMFGRKAKYDGWVMTYTFAKWRGHWYVI